MVSFREWWDSVQKHVLPAKDDSSRSSGSVPEKSASPIQEPASTGDFWPDWERLWSSFQKTIITPKVETAILQKRLEDVKKELPIPIFWLLGKTQSGKTSLIRALTGNDRAEIGNGFRPCTRTAAVYDFPSADHSYLRFLDTRGLGEVDYNPEEDLKQFQQQAHLLIVVMKAMDHAQKSVLEALQKIRVAQPKWPILLVQTALHEGYPQHTTPHLQPYPYAQFPFSLQIPEKLALSLVKQRQWFIEQGIPCVAVDFTLPEDGYDPVMYGLDALWEAIETALPLGLRAMTQQNSKLRKEFQSVFARNAHAHIIAYALASAGAGAIPLPLVGFPVLAAIQAKMFQTIASIYNQDVSLTRFAEVLGTLGLGFLAGLGGRELIKLVPGYGAAVASVYTAAMTYALGQTLCVYFSYAQEGDLPSPEQFRQIYEGQFQEGRELLQGYLKKLLPN